jgi:hypothetical protein
MDMGILTYQPQQACVGQQRTMQMARHVVKSLVIEREPSGPSSMRPSFVISVPRRVPGYVPKRKTNYALIFFMSDGFFWMYVQSLPCAGAIDLAICRPIQLKTPFRLSLSRERRALPDEKACRDDEKRHQQHSHESRMQGALQSKTDGLDFTRCKT